MNLSIIRSVPFSLQKEILPQASSNLLTRVALVALFALGLLIAYLVYNHNHPNSPKSVKLQSFSTKSSLPLNSPSLATPLKKQTYYDDERLNPAFDQLYKEKSSSNNTFPKSQDDEGFDPVEEAEAKRLSLLEQTDQKSRG